MAVASDFNLQLIYRRKIIAATMPAAITARTEKTYPAQPRQLAGRHGRQYLLLGGGGGPKRGGGGGGGG